MTSRLLKPGVATVMTGAKMWATVGDKVDAGGPYQAPNLEDPVQLNGTVRFEADPNPSILWEIESGPGGGIFEPSANVEDPTFLPNAYGTYILKLTGDPTPGAPLSDTATMVVYDAPIVDAGGPYTGTVSTPIQLNGTIVAGSDPTPAAKWLIVSGGTGTFSDTGIEDPTFTPDQEGAYVLKLEAATVDAPLQSDTADLTSQEAGTGLPIFSVALQASLTPEIATGSDTPTYTRASNATLVDYKGTVRTVAAGVPRFQGARLDPDNVTYHTTRIDGITPINENDFFADAKGPFGYLSEESSTNIFTTSDALDPAIDDVIVENITSTLSSTPSPIEGINYWNFEAASTGLKSYLMRTVALTNGSRVPFAGSVYIASGTFTWVRFGLYDGPLNNYVRVWFDIENGVIGTQQSTGVGVITDAQINALDGGFRLFVEGVVDSDNENARMEVKLVSDDGQSNGLANSVGELMAQTTGWQVQSSFGTYIKTEGATASRAVERHSYETAGNLLTNDVSIKLDFTPLNSDVSTNKTLFDSTVDANNYLRIFIQGTNVHFVKQVAGVTNDAVVVIGALVTGQVYAIEAALSSTTGMSISVDGGAAGTDANTDNAVLGTDFYIGSQSNLTQHTGGCTRLLEITP